VDTRDCGLEDGFGLVLVLTLALEDCDFDAEATGFEMSGLDEETEGGLGAAFFFSSTARGFADAFFALGGGVCVDDFFAGVLVVVGVGFFAAFV
jgi:hypothetical protein